MNNNFFGGFDAPAFSIDIPTQTPQVNVKKKKGRGGTLTSLISEGGAFGGAAAGATAGSVVPGIGTVIGGLLGAGLGAFGGRIAENKVRDDRLGLGDAALEGGLTAVLGAPGKALKYGTKAAAAKQGGATLGDALKTGAQAADSSSEIFGAARTKIGNTISQKGSDLTIKEFRLTPTQLTNFKNKFGEDASQVARRYNLTGKNADEIQDSVIKPLQGEFDTISKLIPPVSKSSVESAFRSKYAPLLSSSVQDNKSVGKQLKSQADTILGKYGATIDPSELNSMRKEFDSLVSYADKQANPSRYGVNKRAADAMRSVLQKEADKAGVRSSSGQTFKEVGQELSKLRQLSDNIERQGNTGRGSLPLSLPNLLGGAVGGGALGPAGALGGAVLTGVINSPTGRRVVAKTAQRAGERIAGQGGPTTLARGLAIGATGAGASQLLSPNSNENTTMTPTNAAPPMNSNNMIDQSYSNSGNLSSSLAPEAQRSRYPLENAYADIQRDPKNADYYMQLYEFSNPKGKEDGLNTTTANLVASSANASNTLEQLQGLFGTAGGGSGKLGGSLKNALSRAGLDGNTQTYNDLAASSVSQLARALNGGGQVSDADAAVVVQALPKVTDSAEVAARKFAALRARLEAARQNTLLFNSGAVPDPAGAGQ